MTNKIYNTTYVPPTIRKARFAFTSKFFSTARMLKKAAMISPRKKKNIPICTLAMSSKRPIKVSGRHTKQRMDAVASADLKVTLAFTAFPIPRYIPIAAAERAIEKKKVKKKEITRLIAELCSSPTP